MNSSNRNARGEISRRKILSATSELVSRYGYDSTTISRIEKETGLPASSIYWMFKNKDELITTALEDSYSADPAATRSGRPRWQEYIPGQPLHEQLLTELLPALRTTPGEAPLRVGIMLALEGAASDSQVQIPFKRRREAAQARIQQWWLQVLAEQSPSPGPGKASHLALLTMAFLDGHYISDQEVDEQVVENRARLLANVLWGVFRHDTNTCRHCSQPDPTPPVANASAALDKPASPDEALRCSTRQLMAERGYEGTTVARICSHSGVKRSSLYWRYKDKDSLVKAAVVEPYLKLLRPRLELPAASSRWIEILSAELSIFARNICENPETIKAGLLLELQHWDDPDCAGTTVIDGSRQIEAHLAAWLNQQVGLENRLGDYVAWMFMRLQEGIMLDLVHWGQGLSLTNEVCLQSNLTFALSQWQKQVRTTVETA